MEDDPVLAQAKAEMLAAINACRGALGEPLLSAFPERSCFFCGKSEEEAGALFQSSFFEYIHICRPCTGRAQRVFIEQRTSGGSKP
jgi:hypothetical protein